jgi:filamentous hemagglutinin
VLERETTSAAAAASDFGRLSLPMRLALFDAGFRAAELSGVGSFVPQAVWPGATPVLRASGQLEMTQSGVVTERGGRISLVNPGGAINVGLKEVVGASNAPKGVITLGGGDIFGYARNDFQVNTQRVFIVGKGDMNIWSSSGDIDSGRGANTAVAAPPLAPRRSVDGIVFEVPATTTGSGLGILEDILGRREGTIGLYPAFGEILALDAFIRAPSVVLGSSIRGGDNLQSASVGGAAAVVAAPTANVTPPPASSDNQVGAASTAPTTQDSKPRNALLTVELLGLGAAQEDEKCSEEDQKAGKCRKPAKR